LVRLDRTKDVGTVTPPVDGAVAYQNGLYFDNEGKPVASLCDPELLAKANRRAKFNEEEAEQHTSHEGDDLIAPQCGQE